jgi:hypothetical protein
MSDEGFKALQVQVKELGTAFWACKSCLSFALKMNTQMKAVTKQMEELKEKVEENTSMIRGNAEGVEEVKRSVERVDQKMEAMEKRIRSSMSMEWRDRESRKESVVIHGLEEPAPNVTGNKERREEDLKQCTTIFKAIKANIDREDVSFCRRLGEKGEKPRPLAIGLRDDREAKYLLGLAKELKDTEYKHVSIVPNMTKEQRQEEADLEREAKRRNENLTAEDKAKNLQWLVVGGKGRKRLLKGVPRETEGERTRTIPPVTGTNTTRLGDRGGARWKDNHGKQKRGRKSGSGSESDMDAGEERRRTKSRR